MALSANKVSAIAAPGMTAAATARPLSGGRGIAAENQSPVEEVGFPQPVGVNDNSILHYDDQNSVNQDSLGQRNPQYPPFNPRPSVGFAVEDWGTNAPGGTPVIFLAQYARAIGVYEHNVRLTSPEIPRRGSVLNRYY